MFFDNVPQKITADTSIQIIHENLTRASGNFQVRPEMTLIQIIQGNGKRFIGDNVSSFSKGDMFFLGSLVPHCWKAEVPEAGDNHLPKVTARVLYFSPKLLGRSFFNLSEANKLIELFDIAGRGIEINGSTRKCAGMKLEQLVERQGLDRIIGIFEIFHILSTSSECRTISGKNKRGTLPDQPSERLAAVLSYVESQYNREITLASVASIACLTPPSFCRFFKSHTGQHFIEYLNEYRIARACNQLLNSQRSISEIAFSCGYKTIANFNKIFRELRGMSPSAFRDAS